MSDDVDDFEITDEELTALALAADPGSPFAEDAVAWRPDGTDDDPLLPDWYMPAAASSAPAVIGGPWSPSRSLSVSC